jgi:MFS superfamily sulfate permease-like transporter
MHALRDLVRRTRRDGTKVLISDINEQPLLALRRSELLSEIGEINVYPDIDAALEAARGHVAPAA